MSTYRVDFKLIGDASSLQAAINAARTSLRSLGSLDGKQLGSARRQLEGLQANKDLLKRISDYRKLQRAVADNQRLRAGELMQAARLSATRSEATRQLAEMKAAYASLNAQYKSARGSMAQEARSAWRDNLKEARAEIKAQERLVSDLGRQSGRSSARAERLREQLTNQQGQLTQMRLTLPTGQLAGHELQLRAAIAQTTNALNAEIAALERRNQIALNFSTRQQDLANAWSNFQGSIETAKAFVAPFEEAAQNAITFEAQMSRLKSLTQMRNIRSGDTARVESEMRSMTAVIEKLGATTEYTSNQIAGAANFYAMSGWTSRQIEAMLPATTDLASIARAPIDRVADMLSDDMTAFGVKAGSTYQLAGGKVVDGAKYFSDAVAYAVTNANMDLQTFHESWKYNAPTAHAMNLSLGETIAQNMVAANAGIKGSMSGTSFRQFWVRLAAPPKTAQKSLEEMGLAASDATKQIMETQAAMQEAGVDMNSDLFTKIEALERYYQTLSGDARTGWLKNLTGQTALSGVQSLFDLGKLDEARRYKNEIDSGWIEGWASDTAAVMRDNTQTSIEYLKSAMDALSRTAGQALLPTIRAGVELFTPLVTSAGQWLAQNPALVRSAAAIATGLAAASVSVAGFSLAMAGVRFAQAGFATAGLLFSDLTSKIVIARTALAGFSLSSLGATLASGLSAAATSLSAFGAAALTAARSALLFVATPLGATLTAIAMAGLWAYQNWERVGPALSQIGDALSSGLAPAIDNALQAFATFSSTVVNALAPLAPTIGALVSYIGGGLAGAIIGIGGTLASVISGIVVGLAGLVKTIADLGTGLGDTFSKLSSGDFTGAFDSLSATATAAADNFKAAWVDSFSAVEDGIVGTAQALDTLAHPTMPEVTGGGVGALQAQIDTTGVQASMTELAMSTAQASPSMTELAMSTAQASPSMTELAMSTAQASPSMTELAMSTAQASPSMTELAMSTAQASPSMTELAMSTAQASPSMTELAMSTAQASPSMTELAMSTAQASPSMTELAMSTAQVSPNLDMVGQAAMTTTPSLEMVGASAQAASPGLEMLGASAQAAIGSIGSLAEAAGSVAGALASKAAEIGSIQISVPQITTVSVPTAQNATGGIYAKGSFLTTFAEKTPEAAIPIENSRRAQGLWLQTGSLMGILPREAPPVPFPNESAREPSIPLLMPPTFPNVEPRVIININVNGNADESTVRHLERAAEPIRLSLAEQLADLERERRRRSFA